MNHLSNSARLYFSIAAHVREELEKGNHDAVRRLCHDQLHDPRLPLFHRATFYQILAEDNEEPQHLYFAEQAVSHFHMIAQQVEPSAHMGRLLYKADYVLASIRQERDRELYPPSPGPPKMGNGKGPAHAREYLAAKAAWEKEQKEKRARSKSADDSMSIAAEIDQTEETAMTPDIVDSKDLSDFAIKLGDGDPDDFVIRATVTKTPHSKTSEEFEPLPEHGTEQKGKADYDDSHENANVDMKSMSKVFQTGAAADTDADKPLAKLSVFKHKGRKFSEVYMHRNAEGRLVGNDSATESGTTRSGATDSSVTVSNDQAGASMGTAKRVMSSPIVPRRVYPDNAWIARSPSVNLGLMTPSSLGSNLTTPQSLRFASHPRNPIPMFIFGSPESQQATSTNVSNEAPQVKAPSNTDNDEEEDEDTIMEDA